MENNKVLVLCKEKKNHFILSVSRASKCWIVGCSVRDFFVRQDVSKLIIKFCIYSKSYADHLNYDLSTNFITYWEHFTLTMQR